MEKGKCTGTSFVDSTPQRGKCAMGWFFGFSYTSNYKSEYSYASNGNITYQTVIGNYEYNGTQPHAVTSVDNDNNLARSFEYDVTYTPFRKPETITDNSTPDSVKTYEIFSIINANARFYDPYLARFLSPDPYIQDPEYSQNFNRYSYCLNNQLILFSIGFNEAVVLAFCIF